MEYKDKEEKMIMCFNKEFGGFVLEVKEFRKMEEVKQIKRFERKYSIRIQGVLKDYRKMRERDFNMESLKKIVEVGKRQENQKNLQEKVVKGGIREMKGKRDLWVSEGEMIGKRGKKIRNFRVYFGKKREKMGNDFVRDLMKGYKKDNSLNVFGNGQQLGRDEVKWMKDLGKMVGIEREENRYFRGK